MATLRLALIGLLLCSLIFHLTEACGWTTTALNGTVQSPNFPGNYTNNQSCVYIITAPAGYQVTLNFTDLDIDPTTNCLADFVEIRDGDSETSPLIGRYCNQTVPRRRRTFGNQMWIKFVSDGNATAQGFRATFVSANLQAPYLLIAGHNGSYDYDIYRMDVQTTTYTSPFINSSDVYFVDFDPLEQTIYWVKGWSVAHIQASFINSSRAHTTLTTDSHITCLAVDPLSRLIFYCRYSAGMISMVTMTTMAHKTIINSSLSYPENIALNTAEGVLFWIENENIYTVERANYDGSNRRIVVNESSWIRGLAVDVSNKRLYWTTDYPYHVKMSDLEGKGQSVLFTGSSFNRFGNMRLLNNTLYLTSYLSDGYFHFLRWDIGSPNYTAIAEIPFRMYDFCVVEPGLFSDIELNGCGTNNGGCDSICVPLPNNGSKCMCPDGQTLTRNQTSCVDDINECQQQPAPCDQICTNTESSYLCSCHHGFRANGPACVDINECQQQPAPCDQICTNTEGSYLCSCHHGFHANGPACVDPNKERSSAAVSSAVIAATIAVSVVVIGIIIVVVVIIVVKRRKTKPPERTQLQKDQMYIDLGISNPQPTEGEVQTSM